MGLFRILAFPLSLIYALGVYLRNKCYDFGFYESRSYRTHIVCIGNLSVGGTGKTPLVEYVLNSLQDVSKVAVLSRGYKRKSRGFILANAESTVEELGDEPFQIYRKFGGVIVAVDADRQNGIELLEKNHRPDIIILDDAFQHRKVKASLNILLTAYGDLYLDDWYLPTGNLRDSKGQAKRAAIIIVSKCPADLSQKDQNNIEKRLSPSKYQKIIFSTLNYAGELKSESGSLRFTDIKRKRFTLVTGIANPAPLVAHLKSQELSFEHLAFNDHHFFTATELHMLSSKELIITTEKDYMRLQGKVKPLYYVEVGHKFFNEGGAVLKDAITNFRKLDS